MWTHLVLLCLDALIIGSLCNLLMAGRVPRWPTTFPSPLIYVTWMISRTINMMDFTPRIRLQGIGTIDLTLGALSGSAWPNDMKMEFSTAGHRKGVRNLKHGESVCWQPAKKRELNYSISRNWILPTRVGLKEDYFPRVSRWKLNLTNFSLLLPSHATSARLLTRGIWTVHGATLSCQTCGNLLGSYRKLIQYFFVTANTPYSEISFLLTLSSRSRFLMIRVCMLCLFPYSDCNLFLYIASVFLIVIV